MIGQEDVPFIDFRQLSGGLKNKEVAYDNYDVFRVIKC